ncbi:MAG: hypothetical protein ACREKR_01390 [Candidatus Methylomirabilales bacterium]
MARAFTGFAVFLAGRVFALVLPFAVLFFNITPPFCHPPAIAANAPPHSSHLNGTILTLAIP